MKVRWSVLVAGVATVCACATGEELGGEDLRGSFEAGYYPEGGNGYGDGGTSAAGGGGYGGAGYGGGGGIGGATGGTAGTTQGGAGGVTSSGGAAATSGGTPDSGTSGCGPGLKNCGGLCIPPSPSVGCEPTGCNGCPEPPVNSNPTCETTGCGFECLTGFLVSANGSRCVAEVTGAGGAGTGGTGAGGSATGGTPGAGGTPAGCQSSACPSCGPILGPGCCNQSGACGCPLIPYVATTCG